MNALIADLVIKANFHYKLYQYYCEKINEFQKPKEDEISQDECHRIAGLIGRNVKQI